MLHAYMSMYDSTLSLYPCPHHDTLLAHRAFLLYWPSWWHVSMVQGESCSFPIRTEVYLINPVMSTVHIRRKVRWLRRPFKGGKSQLFHKDNKYLKLQKFLKASSLNHTCHIKSRSSHCNSWSEAVHVWEKRHVPEIKKILQTCRQTNKQTDACKQTQRVYTRNMSVVLTDFRDIRL